MQKQSDGKFYITTPIFYVNDAPHIGHAYTLIMADVLARWMRQLGKDVHFLTGTDEHGQKILQSAQSAGQEPLVWVDTLVNDAWKPVLQALNISNDDFIRTTQDRHMRKVIQFVDALYDNGFIYRGEFNALYCIGCEENKPDSEVQQGTGEHEGKPVCSTHLRPLEHVVEDNYFFKLSAFEQRLLELYESNPEFIQPQSARNEMVNFVKSGLRDLSITRTSFDWGIEAPKRWGEGAAGSKHIIYVWVDALINYISAIDLEIPNSCSSGDCGVNLERFWPAVHIVGKDILRFHAVIWPAMLMAVGIEVPKGIFATGWLLAGGRKMSKTGVVKADPLEYVSEYSADGLRHYLTRCIKFGADGPFVAEDVAGLYTSELAAGLGNLVSRTVSLILKNFNAREFFSQVVKMEDEAVLGAGQLVDAAVHKRGIDGINPDIYAAGEKIKESIDDNFREFISRVRELSVDSAAGLLWDSVSLLNLFLAQTEPWKIGKVRDVQNVSAEGDETVTQTLLYTLGITYRYIGALAVGFCAILPNASLTIWKALLGDAALHVAPSDIPLTDIAKWHRVVLERTENTQIFLDPAHKVIFAPLDDPKE